MAKTFLRTLCTTYLCDELCHTVGAKEFLRTLKGEQRGQRPEAVVAHELSRPHATLRSVAAAAPFLGSGSATGDLSQDGIICHLDMYIYTD